MTFSPQDLQAQQSAASINHSQSLVKSAWKGELNRRFKGRPVELTTNTLVIRDAEKVADEFRKEGWTVTHMWLAPVLSFSFRRDG